eukprot:363925-Chlamydomonas_euryale.AAC.14
MRTMSHSEAADDKLHGGCCRARSGAACASCTPSKWFLGASWTRRLVVSKSGGASEQRTQPDVSVSEDVSGGTSHFEGLSCILEYDKPTFCQTNSDVVFLTYIAIVYWQSIMQPGMHSAGAGMFS